MTKSLYLVRKAMDVADLLPDGSPSGTSVILLEEGVLARIKEGLPVFAVQNDVARYKSQTSAQLISYQDLFEMIFEADKVVVL